MKIAVNRCGLDFCAKNVYNIRVNLGRVLRSEISKKGFFMHVNELKAKSPQQLLKMAEDMGIENPAQLNVQQLRFAVMRVFAADKKVTLIGDGVLERMQDGFGFLRAPESNYLAGPDDLYVSPALIKKYGLKTGDYIEGQIQAPQNESERYFALETIERVNGGDPDKLRHRVSFDDMTPLYPDEMLKMEVVDDKDKGRSLSARVIDLIAPTGRGQRSLIVAPPRTGKTVMLQNIAHSIATNYPDVKLIVLLIDERPEEVTDMQRSVKGEVISSTFDLLDSITRLGRAYNTVVPSSGKVLTGGVDAYALQRPKRFFGAARNIEGGGSLTIIATALVDTGSKMDEVIFEEFKGTGNSEIILDRKLSDKRVYPAIDITKSGTRKEDLLVDKDTLAKMYVLRRIINPMGTLEAMEFLLDKLRVTKTNADFFASMNQ